MGVNDGSHIRPVLVDADVQPGLDGRRQIAFDTIVPIAAI
jgi:hypothetical protein